jgi:protein-disulfide isomerase
MPSATARRPRWLVPTLIVAVAALLVILSLSLRGNAPSPGAASEGPTTDGAPAVAEPQEQVLLDLARRTDGDPLAVGPVDAPVTLVMYSDYQCIYCASWTATTQPAMLERVETGELRIEFRDIAIFGDDSLRAAHAATAAGLQGRYLDFHEAMFAGGDKRSPAGLTEDALVTLAGELGLDAERFASDLRSPEVAARVLADRDEAASIGAYSTPTFLMGGEPLVGAMPTESFVEAFDRALARAEA